MKIQCPAKVNLFLEVTGKRRDGYHILETVFAKINLFDTLDLLALPEGPVELVIENRTAAALDAGPSNLVLRAAEAFRKAFGVRHGLRIALEKKIPIGAGLGGGSSDAAGTLLGLSRLFGHKPGPRTRSSLKRLAAGLGADVPFFLLEETFALGRGVGDRLAPLEVAKTPPMVLVYPRLLLPTAAVYGALRRPERGAVLTSLSQLGKLKKKLANGRPISEWAGLLFNRLEEAVLPSHERVRQAKELLARVGALGTLMSGSGSSVFGFFSDAAEAERAASRLKGYPWDVYSTCCLG